MLKLNDEWQRPVTMEEILQETGAKKESLMFSLRDQVIYIPGRFNQADRDIMAEGLVEFICRDPKGRLVGAIRSKDQGAIPVYFDAEASVWKILVAPVTEE